jgi:hypothetical protein
VERINRHNEIDRLIEFNKETGKLGVNSFEAPNSILNPDGKLVSNDMEGLAIERVKQPDAVAQLGAAVSAFAAGQNQAAVGMAGAKSIQADIAAKLEAQIAVKQADIKAKDSRKGLFSGIQSLFGFKISKEKKELKAIQELVKQGATDPAKLSEAYEKLNGEPLCEVKYAQALEARQIEASLSTDDKKDIVALLQEQAAALSGDLNKVKDKQGIISRGMSVVNNVLGIGTNNNQTKAQISAYQKQVADLAKSLESGDTKDFAAKYKALTGEMLTAQSLEGLARGELKTQNSGAAESILDYRDSTKLATDVLVGTTASIVSSAAASVLVVGTGGTALIASALIAGTLNGGITAGMNAIDGFAKDGSYTYTVDELGRDVSRRFISGAAGRLINPLKVTTASAVENGLIKVAGSKVAENAAAKAAIRVTTAAASEFLDGYMKGAVGGAASYISRCVFSGQEFDWKGLRKRTLDDALWRGTTQAGASVIQSGFNIARDKGAMAPAKIPEAKPDSGVVKWENLRPNANPKNPDFWLNIAQNIARRVQNPFL